MTLTPLGQCPTPDLDHLIAKDDPPVFSLQPPGSAGELWCGVVVPSPPCSPILKSTSETNSVGYGQAKSRFVHQCSGSTDGQVVKNDTLVKEPVGRSISSSSSTPSMVEVIRGPTASDAAMPPLNRKCLSPPKRPGTAGLPVALALSLPDVQPRPSSAPAYSSATDHSAVTPWPRPSTPVVLPCSITTPDIPVNAPLKGDSESAAKRSNAISMSGMMAPGTRQAIASPILLHSTIPVPSWEQGPPGLQMPPAGSTRVNGGYPSLATGAVPPINYNMFGMNIHATPSVRRGGFPFLVPQQLQPATVPQNLLGRMPPAANPYVPGFPAFAQTPINCNWGISGQNGFPMMPYPDVAYPNVQCHADERQRDPTSKTLIVPHGQQINASAFKQQNANVLPPGTPRQFIVHDPSSFSMAKTQEETTRSKRRRTSVSTSSSTSSLSGSGCDASTSSIASAASTSATSMTSTTELQPGPTFICRLDDCNTRLQSASKRSFNHHLILGHSFHGSGNRELTRCKWRDEDGMECGKILQMQSLVKHVCEKHFNSLGMSCSLCGSRQARADNMVRHLVVCKPFARAGREVQRKIWEELVPNKSFDEVYLQGRDVKRRKVEE